MIYLIIPLFVVIVIGILGYLDLEKQLHIYEEELKKQEKKSE